MALTREARLELIQRLLQLTPNLTNTNTNTNANISVDIPGLDLNLSIPGNLSLPVPTSTSLKNTLLEKLDEEITVDTASGEELTGTLVAVGTDYIVLIQNNGTLSFVRIDKIETVQETSF